MKKSVLLVDDEIINHVMNRHLLEQNLLIGDIDSVRDGREAIEFLEDKINKSEHLPDIIFLDINMPVLNGFQFLEQINSHFSTMICGTTIVILSSILDQSDRDRAVLLGAKLIITKPLFPQIIDKITALK